MYIYIYFKEIVPAFYSISKDFAKQRYNTPYTCNVILL